MDQFVPAQHSIAIEHVVIRAQCCHDCKYFGKILQYCHNCKGFTASLLCSPSILWSLAESVFLLIFHKTLSEGQTCRLLRSWTQPWNLMKTIFSCGNFLHWVGLLQYSVIVVRAMIQRIPWPSVCHLGFIRFLKEQRMQCNAAKHRKMGENSKSKVAQFSAWYNTCIQGRYKVEFTRCRFWH